MRFDKKKRKQTNKDRIKSQRRYLYEPSNQIIWLVKKTSRQH